MSITKRMTKYLNESYRVNEKISAEGLAKFNQLSKKCQAEVDDIYYDGYWNIILKNYDRVLSEETWGEVKWELQQMVKKNDFTLQW